MSSNGRAPRGTTPLGRHLTRLLVVVTLALGMVGLAVGPASAHHPEISGSADCTGTVAFTATAWAGQGTVGSQAWKDSRTNGAIQVFATQGSGGETLVGSGVFSPDNGYSFDGSLTRPVDGGDVTLRVHATQNWANGSGPGEDHYATVPFPSNCAGKPTVTVTGSCADGWNIALGNSGQAPVEFTVHKPNGDTEQVSVTNGTATRHYDVVEDTGQTVSVAASGLGTVSKSLSAAEANCEKSPAAPAATVTGSCEGFDVSLTNPGDQGTSVVITKPDGSTEEVSVPGGTTTPITRHYAVIEDQAQTVAVVSGETTLAQKSLTAQEANCKKPAPTGSISVDCTGFDVILGNEEGADSATFVVTKPDGETEVVTVPAGASTSRGYPVTGGQDNTVTVRSGGEVVASKSFHASCVKGTEAQRPPTVAGVDAATPAPAALPETGTSTTTEWGLLAGLALVGAGGVLLLSRRVGRG